MNILAFKGAWLKQLKNSFYKTRLTGLLSTATMISPRTIFPAKPLVVGFSPALAARLFAGTCGTQVLG